MSSRKQPKQVLEEYFVRKLHRKVPPIFTDHRKIGPRDISRHSKWPRALRMHGSVFPKLILPTTCICCWSAITVVLSERVHPIEIHPIVITVLGLVVALALNLRSSTAYERYMEGRRMWSSLSAVSLNLSRVIWIHAEERPHGEGNMDLMGKITCLNMISAFAVALKHKLRFEPHVEYDDLQDLIGHLETFAKSAGRPEYPETRMRSCKRIGELLRIPMFRSNPRKELKRATCPLGNLPLEILTYISSYVHEIMDNGTFLLGIAQTHAQNNLETLHHILAQSERVLNTPLPLAYSIAISQITWIYVLSLPFQLVHLMDWLTVPVTTFSAYIILGFHAIGNEIENPFGPEVNDLPLELYCTNIASDIAIISSKAKPKPHEFVKHPQNKPLYPTSSAGSASWFASDESTIREALRARAATCKGAVWKRQCSVVSAPCDREKWSFHSRAASSTSTAWDEEAGDPGMPEIAGTKTKDL
ncbi:UPF0187-domain-containing protein [Polyplosphaeria fusca]|uniref:UPF0187-domain-containing protein n=1 Tax=Polyplosphaeria fusca TaxID=682080 RepID=A0A9P4V3Y2_9PLEO|nr:UPF0187-domain-containing protein [Polyplosphaeria fusca]